MFGVPFDEIAPIVGRSPSAARQLASRARRRVQGAARVPGADFTRQRQVVDAFLAASRGGDFDALLALLDPDVVLRADHAAVDAGASSEVRGSAAVAGTFSGRARFAQPALVNGAVGAMWAPHGRPRFVFDFTITRGKIVKIDILADPGRLRQLDLPSSTTDERACVGAGITLGQRHPQTQHHTLWKTRPMDVLHIESSDGTRIAAHIDGAGPPLLLVHGATADHSTTWRFVGPLFEQRFTVYRMDRRGRGESGDGNDYSIEREFEDVAALVDSIGGPVFVVGHSYGAGVTLGALLLTPNIKRFVHYEGGIPAVYPTPEPTIDRIQRHIDKGDRHAALAILIREIVGIDPDEFRAASGEEAWAARLRNAHTLPRELRAENDFDITTIESRLRNVETPILFLLGGESPKELAAPSERLASVLPNNRFATIEGESHAAMFGSPNTFVEIVNRFLDEGAA